MSEKRIDIKKTNFEDNFCFKDDYRATVGYLKKALECFYDDLPIGILYDSEFAYCDLHQIFVGKDGLVILVGD